MLPVLCLFDVSLLTGLCFLCSFVVVSGKLLCIVVRRVRVVRVRWFMFCLFECVCFDFCVCILCCIFRTCFVVLRVVCFCIVDVCTLCVVVVCLMLFVFVLLCLSLLRLLV